jgi:hypothetical protein
MLRRIEGFGHVRILLKRIVQGTANARRQTRRLSGIPDPDRAQHRSVDVRSRHGTGRNSLTEFQLSSIVRRALGEEYNMSGHVDHAKNWWRLDEEPAPLGIFCDAGGPRIGPVRLLQRKSSGWEPRPVGVLNRILQSAGYPVDLATRSGGLAAAARAMNEDDVARAAICTLHMRLSPRRSDTVATQAISADWFAKASVDDPIHPGWPAGTPDSKGGEFRDKTDEEKIARSRAQNTFRRMCRVTILNAVKDWQDRVERLESEGGVLPASHDFIHDKIKHLDDPLLLDNLGLMAAAMERMQTEIDVAKKFALEGPKTMEELRVSDEDIGFSSMRAFKKDGDNVAIDLEKYFRPAAPGYQFHHVVEWAMNRGKFAPEILHNTINIVEIPTLFHEAVSGIYSSKPVKGGPTVRQIVTISPIEKQREYGIFTMQRLGISKK